MSIDLTDPLQWNLVYGNSLIAPPNGSIQPITFTTTHREIVVGIRVNGQPTWRWGGYLTEQVAQLPSSTADLFSALVQVGSYRLTCRQYQAIALSPALPLPLVCTINFPRYFEACDVQVYARNDP